MFLYCSFIAPIFRPQLARNLSYTRFCAAFGELPGVLNAVTASSAAFQAEGTATSASNCSISDIALESSIAPEPERRPGRPAGFRGAELSGGNAALGVWLLATATEV